MYLPYIFAILISFYPRVSDDAYLSCGLHLAYSGLKGEAYSSMLGRSHISFEGTMLVPTSWDPVQVLLEHSNLPCLSGDSIHKSPLPRLPVCPGEASVLSQSSYSSTVYGILSPPCLLRQQGVMAKAHTRMLAPSGCLED